MPDTIYALSSGQPPAGIGVIRISGPDAGQVLEALSGPRPNPREATLRTLKGADDAVLDQALVLWLPGPGTATGEDIAELHCHGGRAVISAILQAIGEIENTREAKAGEFTRRAFMNGRMDLAQAEGLGDLLAAETELQRQSAIGAMSGVLSRDIFRWREKLLSLSAQVEAALDFSDEDDVEALPAEFWTEVKIFARDLSDVLERPRVDRLRDGIRIVLAGPPNSGKSSLFNALTSSEAAIVAPIAGTTRDIIERPVSISGVPFVFTDTAGIRAQTDDQIEQIGIGRAKAMMDTADIVLWLGQENEGPNGSLDIENFADISDREHPKICPDYRVSATTGQGVDQLRLDLVKAAEDRLPKPGEAALNLRQYELVKEAYRELALASSQSDPLIIGEHLRQVRLSFDAIVGQTSTEDMLDGLFGRFCIGK